MTVSAYVRAPGVQVEAIGDTWGAFSTLSGETHLLNASSVAILDMLFPEQPISHESVCNELMVESGLGRSAVEQLLLGTWETFIRAGLVRQVMVDGAAS